MATPRDTNQLTLNADPLIVARVGAPWGVRGWVHIQSYTEPRANLASYKSWFTRLPNAAWQPCDDFELRPHKDGFVCQFAGVSDRDQAATLRGQLIGVTADQFAALDAEDIYWHELVGAQVDNADGKLGTVERLIETGAHDVLVVAGADGTERLIPFVDEYVKSIDKSAGRVLVDWQADW